MASYAWRWILAALSDNDLDTLLDHAGRSIWHGHRHGARLPFDIRQHSWGVRTTGITYVGLTLNDMNVGCQGNTEPKVLLLSVVTNAFNAAFRDSRFGGLTDWGMQNAQLTVYNLHDVEIFQGLSQREVADKISPDCSVQVNIAQTAGILLSTMQTKFRSSDNFIDAVLDKAGVHVHCPCQDITFKIYRTQVIGPVSLAKYDYQTSC